MLQTRLQKNKQVEGAGNVLSFDVMKNHGETFVCSIKMPYNPLFKVTMKEIVDYIYQKRPTLKYEKGVEIYINE